MPLFADAFSSYRRPVVRGLRGAVASAHPLATAAGQEILAAGGNAADSLIAAQAVLAVIAPDACGIGGDMLALVRDPDGSVTAVGGTGKSPIAMTEASGDGANSITVPGLADAWETIARRWGAMPLSQCLAPAIRIARAGMVATPALVRAVAAQRHRLLAGGAQDWIVLNARERATIVQPALARLLERIGTEGAQAFYRGEAARAVETAIARLGGTLTREDLATHETLVSAPVTSALGEWTLHVQPAPTQGILLAMALRARQPFGALSADRTDHIGIELAEAAFAHRSDCANGQDLLARALAIDPDRASRRGGPRAYLHTAGVCTSDASGLTLSSLVSVFDDFGSGVFVPDLGITLNNRAGGFTNGANAAAPGKRPVHTLAPMMLDGPQGAIAMATPGADGQVQTLLQVVGRIIHGEETLDAAIAAPRWRSEGGRILIERDHPAIADLAARGHDLEPLAPGEMRFGAVVAAGHAQGGPFAVSDWRRECWSGVA